MSESTSPLSSSTVDVLIGFLLGLGTTLLVNFQKSRKDKRGLIKALKIELMQVPSNLKESTFMPIFLTVWDQLKITGTFLDFSTKLKNNLLKLHSQLNNRNNLINYHLTAFSPPFAYEGKFKDMNAFFINPKPVILGENGESTPLIEVLAGIRTDCETLCNEMSQQVDDELKKIFPWSVE